jgi:hypothetical protein
MKKMLTYKELLEAIKEVQAVGIVGLLPSIKRMSTSKKV